MKNAKESDTTISCSTEQKPLIKMSEINLIDLSCELLCNILKYLHLHDLLNVSMLCKKLNQTVNMHLKLCRRLDFSRHIFYGFMPIKITDDHLHVLLKKCTMLEVIYGLHPHAIERRRLRKRLALTVPGVIEALKLCPHLKAVETSSLHLMEAILHQLPKVNIIGHFKNRDGTFPPQSNQRLRLPSYPHVTSLNLTGVEVPELTVMPQLQQLYLKWVKFTKTHPFRSFVAPHLRVFVMRQCMGPQLALRYLPLIIALSAAPSLFRLELFGVPLLGGLIQRAVEDSWKNGGFRKLRALVISGCKNILESDLGHLLIVASQTLELLALQPSLTKDTLFVSLTFAHSNFPKLTTLKLGYVDDFSTNEEWSPEYLSSLGLAEIADTPSPLSDSGMKVISKLFPHLKSLSIHNCPHLLHPDSWTTEQNDAENSFWPNLRDLTMLRCHCIKLKSFAVFLASLPHIETIILEDMFREPPKGCSHVGLSAGTGLGMSSAAVVSSEQDALPLVGLHPAIGQVASPPPQQQHHEEPLPHCPGGPLTRHKRKLLLEEEQPDFVDKSCQCSSDDIRQAMKVGNDIPEGSSISSPGPSFSPSPIPFKKRNLNSSYKIMTHDRATSTSDPIQEEDAILTLRVGSSTLLSLTLISCGISDLVIDLCRQLIHLEVKSCRILKHLQLHTCTCLTRIGISQCPKIKMNSLLDTVLGVPARRARFVFLQPTRTQALQSEFNSIESKLFSHPNARTHYLCLFKDYSNSPSDRAQYRENLLVWLRLCNKMVLSYIKKKGIKSSGNVNSDPDIVYIKGSLPDGKYEVQTTIPWLSQLWKVHESSTPESLEIPLVDSFSPQHYNHCFEEISKHMTELIQAGTELLTSHVAFYIHLPEKTVHQE